METTWGNALQVFAFGFSGVFFNQIVLMFGVMLYSAKATPGSNKVKKKEEQKA